jgi:hypothetical protein
MSKRGGGGGGKSVMISRRWRKAGKWKEAEVEETSPKEAEEGNQQPVKVQSSLPEEAGGSTCVKLKKKAIGVVPLLLVVPLISFGDLRRRRRFVKAGK